MLNRRTGLAGTLPLLLALVLAACGQVGTNTLAGDDSSGASVSPTITSQPSSLAVPEGQTAKFVVVATGTAPLAYQWRKNGDAIEGAIDDTYEAPANAEDDGAAFSVMVSNPVGAVESEAAKLTVMATNTPPAITSEPADQSITSGQTATFNVIASGSGPLSYQWYRNGAMVSGATGTTYTTPTQSTTDNGDTFSVSISNAFGSVTSRSARLGVSAAAGGAVAPTITAQPADTRIKAGQTATFSVTASGSAPLLFQWTVNGADIPGANAASYTTPPAAAYDNGAIYAVVVDNSVGYVTSRGAKLTVSGAVPSITTQPADQNVASGASAKFTVVASGMAPLAYQWLRNGATIADATSASFTTGSLTASDSGASYSVRVSNAAGRVTSRAARLTVSGNAPVITTQPADAWATAGGSANFAVVAAGGAPLSYQWRRNGNPISNATSASYTTPALSSSDGGSTFTVTVTNPSGAATSRAAVLTITTSAVAPTISVQPGDQAVAPGKGASFSVVAGGTAPLTYQWRRNGAPITGATGASYSTPAASISDSGASFSVVITNAAGSVASRSAQLTVTAVASAPSIAVQPADQAVVTGKSATFSVVATGSAPLSYQWRRNGTVIAGATGPSYSTPATSTSDSGASFSVAVGNVTGSVSSRAAKLTVTAATSAPGISVQPADQAVVAGKSATFSVVATGSAPLSYQWRRNGAAIGGATSAGYSTPATSTSDGGAAFSVLISNSAGSVISRAALLTVTAGPAAPSITTQPADQALHAGQTATFSVTATGSGPLSYQWRRNGTAVAGASATSYTTGTLSTSDSGTTYSVTVRNPNGSATSRNAALTVTPPVTTGSGTDVVTYKNDLARTGQNLTEKTLTPGNVNAASFGKLRFLGTDGKVDAQPLYLSGLNVGGSNHNVVFVATENDSVYAFDADTGTQLWKSSLVPAGETVMDEPPQFCGNLQPTIGVTATPVIDRSAGAHGTIYLVAMTKSGSSATWHQRLHALDVTSGAETSGGPTEITGSYPSAGGTITFDPVQYLERAALLLVNHTIYTTWTSHCDNKFYTGWIMGYSQSTLRQTAVLNVAPNSGGIGPSIWMSGGGPAADAAGNIYAITANGAFESSLNSAGFPNQGDYGNSFLKLSTGGAGLSVADYFTVHDTARLTAADFDLGSGGVMLLPDLTDASGTVRHLAVGAGKDSNLYVVNRDAMGHFDPGTNNIWQELDAVLGGGIWSTPAYFNGHVYYGIDNGSLVSFSISGAKLVSPAGSATTVTFGYPGTAPAVSANGTSNGIVWAHQNGTPAVLYAFDANNVSRTLYSSSQAANGRDQFGTGNKYITPVIADGKVFVGTTNGVAVFGLLN